MWVLIGRGIGIPDAPITEGPQRPKDELSVEIGSGRAKSLSWQAGDLGLNPYSRVALYIHGSLVFEGYVTTAWRGANCPQTWNAEGDKEIPHSDIFDARNLPAQKIPVAINAVDACSRGVATAELHAIGGTLKGSELNKPYTALKGLIAEAVENDQHSWLKREKRTRYTGELPWVEVQPNVVEADSVINMDNPSGPLDGNVSATEDTSQPSIWLAKVHFPNKKLPLRVTAKLNSPTGAILHYYVEWILSTQSGHLSTWPDYAAILGTVRLDSNWKTYVFQIPRPPRSKAKEPWVWLDFRVLSGDLRVGPVGFWLPDTTPLREAAAALLRRQPTAALAIEVRGFVPPARHVDTAAGGISPKRIVYQVKGSDIITRLYSEDTGNNPVAATVRRMSSEDASSVRSIVADV